jgi:hypothetical protein
MMIRTQVQLDEETYEALRRRAFTEKKSLSAVVRALLAQALGVTPRKKRRRRYNFDFIGKFRGEETDVSVRHDDYLWGGPHS